MPCHWISLLKNTIINSLQANQKTFPPTNVNKKNSGRVSPCTLFRKNKKGSLTVEAAFILPLFFLGMVTLICLMDLFRIQAEVTVSLNESAKELGMYAYAVRDHLNDSPVGSISDGVCIAYVSAKIKDQEYVTIRMYRSNYQNHVVDLIAEGSYRMPISLFPIPDIRFQNRARVHDWTGYDGTGDRNGKTDSEEMVYITDRQTVYHSHADCTHLELAIIETTRSRVDKQRNENGGKYYPCPHCAKGAIGVEMLYITKSGDRYHTAPQCQSLVRTVKLVKKSEVHGLDECARCRLRGEDNGN